MLMARILRIVLVLASVLICLGSNGVDVIACECDLTDYGFLVSSGAELPNNAHGIPWWGTLGPQESLTKDSFSLWKVSGAAVVEVDFDLEPPELAKRPEVGFHERSPVILVVPRGGFLAGVTYRATFRRRKGRELRVEGERVDEQTIEVTVSADELQSVGVRPTIDITKARTRKLTVSTSGGSCSVKIRATKVTASMTFPKTHQKWADALLYSVTVDGLSWRPSADFCSPTPPGMSWVGKGGELFFTHCPEPGEWGTPDNSLTEGTHVVEFIAWLPGTDHRFSATTEVELNCYDEMEIYQLGDE